MMLTLGLAFNSLRGILRHPWVRTIAGVLVIALGAMMLLANPAGHGHHSQPPSAGHSQHTHPH
jgi:cytochrome c biogenesis protein CcdA